MATIYRSVKLVLQNSSNELLTVAGFGTLKGEWLVAPKQSDLVLEQSTRDWITYSGTPGSGTHAFIRFALTAGFVEILWSRPWVGPFRQQISIPPHLESSFLIDEDNPDNPVLWVTVTEAPHQPKSPATGLARSEALRPELSPAKSGQ